MYKASDPQPEPLKTDHRGTSIEIGCRVAYNRSGDVILGTVVMISKNQWRRGNWYWELLFELTVKDEEGKVSRIKNPRSFVIIPD